MTGEHDTGEHFHCAGKVVSAAASDATRYVHVRNNGLNY